MKWLLGAVAVLGLATAPASAQPTPAAAAGAEVVESVRAWVGDQRAATDVLGHKLAAAEADVRQFRDYLRRMRADAAAQKTVLALGDLRPFEFDRAERNWEAWRAIADDRLAAVTELAAAVAERRTDQEERWALLGDDVAEDLAPAAAAARREAERLRRRTLSLLDRLAALAEFGAKDAKAAIALCDDILKLLRRTADKLQARFLAQRVGAESIATAPEDVRKDAAALLAPFTAGPGFLTAWAGALRANAAALATGLIVFGLAVWRVRRLANGLERAAEALGDARPGLLERLVACLLIAAGRSLGLAMVAAAIVALAAVLGDAAPGWLRAIVRLAIALFVWRLAVAFVRLAFAAQGMNRLFEQVDAAVARARLERLLLWLFVAEVQTTLLTFAGLFSAPVMLVFLALMLFGVRSLVRTLRADRLAALGLAAGWAIAARQWRGLLVVGAVVSLAAAGLGYVNAAWFIAWGLLSASAVVLLAAVVWLAGSESIERWGAPLDAAGRRQLQIVWGVVAVAALVLSLPGAVGAGAMAEATARAVLDFGVEVSGQRIRVGQVLAAVAWVFAAWALGRVLSLLLTRRIFPGAVADPGVRQAITTTIGYALLTAGLLLGIRALGFDLTSFAIVAGALSVGVGFGLQDLVSNFVSGLIILYERPFRPGDILEHEGMLGWVKHIRTRSTLMQTFDDAELVLPNSELLTKRITNWTLSNFRARLIIPVGVAYGSDVDLVRDTLLELASAHRGLVDVPRVYFHAFGDSALEFRLMVWVDIRERLQVSSDLHFAIDRAFRQKGIQIPFPQRDVHLRAVRE